MANLRANKITSTEVFETTGSVQFDGSGDYLSSSISELPTGNDVYTIESWIYAKTLGVYGIAGWGSYGTTNGVNALRISDTGYIRNYWWSNDLDTPAGLITTNKWFHIAATFDGITRRIFVNGVLSASDTPTGHNVTTTSNFTVGTTNSTEYWDGHISNLRILKGTALYTKNFTPPTRELEVIPNTVLLACQSTTRANEEKTGKTITVNGNAVANELTPGLLTDVVKSGGTSAITGSVEFSGGGAGQNISYLQFPNDSSLILDSNFTIEFWIRSQNISLSSHILVNQSQDFTIQYNNSDTAIIVYDGSNRTIGTFDKNTWIHFALVRSGSTLQGYINGIAAGSSWTNSSSTKFTLSQTILGARWTNGYNFDGFISNLRVLKGTALYTGNFIPPTRELKRLPNTVLLCCKNSSDPTAEETGKTITANGDPAASNFTPPVGFDGTVTFDGVTKINTPNYFYLPTGNTEDRGRGRGVFGGGFVLIGGVNTIDYITISSTGNASDFGDLTQSRWGPSACSSHTRGVFGGGYTSPAQLNTIDYITISSTGNANDFGDLTQSRYALSSCSSSTRGVFGGGGFPSVFNTIDYITISSTGNASDFGDLTQIRRGLSSCSSFTRGVFGGGYSPTLLNTIDYITISSTGNASDFGDLTQSRYGLSSCSSSTRGVFGGGALSVFSFVNTIDYITISSTGNASDFGDLILIRQSAGSCSSSIRGVFGGGRDPDSNTIDYITISSTGNASDFGDLTEVRHWVSACSDSHGGLG